MTDGASRSRTRLLTRRAPLLFLVIALLVEADGRRELWARGAAPDWVWWEAESPRASNFPEQNPFAPGDDKATKALSGGRWVGAAHPNKTLFLEYEVKVASAASFEFFARKFWHHGPFRWRFDDQPWRPCVWDVPLLDDVSLAEFVNANWVDLGAVTLGAGTHVLRIEVEASADAVAFDCFLLTPGAFVARGKMKPDETYDAAPAGWFAYQPAGDPFAQSALDLRSLNETFAGEGGFIQVKGDSFVHGKTGRPVRFWAVNTTFEVLPLEGVAFDRLARHLSKLGVNMLRVQGALWRDGDVTKVDEVKVAQLHHLVVSLKREGIYLALSTYFPLWLRPKGVAGLEGYNGDVNAFALPFFNERFQAIQKSWWKALLTKKNPQTGATLLEDPTLAFLEILNEDGLLFWTFSPYQNVPAPQMQLIETLFGRWLTARYGGIDRAFAKWGRGGKVKGDDAASGRVGFMALWEMLNRADARARDTATFLAELQRKYYDQMCSYLKKDLGFKGSVTGSNWITADARVLGPLDKWSNAGCDFMDRHGYYGGPHEGPRASYLLSNGDRYNDASALLFETGKGGEPSHDLPIMDLAYNGKPSTISEINWVMPNRFRADMPLLAAAYGALQGSDAFFFFLRSEIEPPQQLMKFSISDPVGMGQFPATALIFRKGLVRTADVALHVEPRLSDLQALKGIPIVAPQNLDELRKKDVPPGTPSAKANAGSRPATAGSIDPLAFLVGRVEVNVTEAGGPSQVVDVSKFIDREKRVARSSTGELRWDYGRGLATVDAPAAQGVTGFLSKAGAVALGDVIIESHMEYGSVVLVSLDGAPLKTSGRMLLQVMSEDSNLGWSAPGKGLRNIVDVGGPPIIVRNFEGKVSLKRADARSLKVSALDFSGYKNDALKAPATASEIVLLATTPYYIIER